MHRILGVVTWVIHMEVSTEDGESLVFSLLLS